ncbi:MAG: hypothetical protein N2654_02160 [Deltaproteobacteria bacterium]|nr:hypothetical protein [Deltaproteobacteria bacterium]
MELIKFSVDGKNIYLGIETEKNQFPLINDTAKVAEKFLSSVNPRKKIMFSRYPFPHVTAGSISISHKIINRVKIILIAFSEDLSQLGVDLELDTNNTRCLKILKRYGISSDLYEPVQLFGILEAGVKYFSSKLTRRVYLNEIGLDNNLVYLRSLDDQNGYPLCLSFDKLRVSLVYK